ncbi:hypothetical protein NMH_0046 [Neisseria meningitidis H44/76]|uniref:Uncharacterized protein n=1 Tax=Neisseria meningitidis serogroup B / serotype 15 (strain H44/76) TaxID=909420 RepID=E6MV41_NEIMH|nr:hypothetical protein NMH_0046 [Neisseria meningitidis H44/76]
MKFSGYAAGSQLEAAGRAVWNVVSGRLFYNGRLICMQL